MLVEDDEKIVPGVGGFICPAAVDEDRPLARRGDLKLADQAFALHVAGRAFVVVVEADLAAGDDFRLGEKRGELGQGLVVGRDSAVGINARACIKARQTRPILSSAVELAAEIERLVHFLRALADADGEHRAHTSLPCAGEHGFAVIRVAGTVQVSVGIDQQTSLEC